MGVHREEQLLDAETGMIRVCIHLHNYPRQHGNMEPISVKIEGDRQERYKAAHKILDQLEALEVLLGEDIKGE